jgi:hypothetical protein
VQIRLAVPYRICSPSVNLKAVSDSLRIQLSDHDMILSMQEPTAYVFIQTVDGDIEKVEKDVALLSPFVHREVNRHGRGYSRDSPVALPKQVSFAVLKLVLEYCRFHRVSGRSDKVRPQGTQQRKGELTAMLVTSPRMIPQRLFASSPQLSSAALNALSRGSCSIMVFQVERRFESELILKVARNKAPPRRGRRSGRSLTRSSSGWTRACCAS